MATYYLAPDPCQSTFFVPGGNTPGNGVKVFTYLTGTTTKTSVAKDSAGAALHTNPIILDSGGNLPSASSLWIEDNVNIDVVYAPSNDTDPPGAAYRTMTNIIGIAPNNASTTQWIATGTPTFVSATQFRLDGDVTGAVHVGRRMETVNTGGTYYSRVTSSVFATSTTVGVINDGGVIDSGLSAASYGILSSADPSTPLLTDFYPIVRSSTAPHVLNANIQNASSDVSMTMPAYSVALANLPAGVFQDYAGSTAPNGWLDCNGSTHATSTYPDLFAAVGRIWGGTAAASTFGVPDSRSRSRIGRGAGILEESVVEVSSTANAVPVASNADKWITGMSVALNVSSSGFTGLISSQTSGFIIRTNATSVSFASTLSAAQIGTAMVATSTGSLTMTHTYTTRTVGEYGGEEAHAQSAAELYAHTHAQQAETRLHTGASVAGPTGGAAQTSGGTTQSTGGFTAMNNMIPYYVCMTIIKH